MRILWAVIDEGEVFLAHRACARKEYHVRTVRTAEQVKAEIGRGYDVVIVDQNLPDIVGIELVRQLRAGGVRVPLAIYADFRCERNGGLSEEGSHAGAVVYAKEVDPTCELIVEQLPLLLGSTIRG